MVVEQTLEGSLGHEQQIRGLNVERVLGHLLKRHETFVEGFRFVVERFGFFLSEFCLIEVIVVLKIFLNFLILFSLQLGNYMIVFILQLLQSLLLVAHLSLDIVPLLDEVGDLVGVASEVLFEERCNLLDFFDLGVEDGPRVSKSANFVGSFLHYNTLPEL